MSAAGLNEDESGGSEEHLPHISLSWMARGGRGRALTLTLRRRPSTEGEKVSRSAVDGQVTDGAGLVFIACCIPGCAEHL